MGFGNKGEGKGKSESEKKAALNKAYWEGYQVAQGAVAEKMKHGPIGAGIGVTTSAKRPPYYAAKPKPLPKQPNLPRGGIVKEEEKAEHAQKVAAIVLASPPTDPPDWCTPSNKEFYLYPEDGNVVFAPLLRHPGLPPKWARILDDEVYSDELVMMLHVLLCSAGERQRMFKFNSDLKRGIYVLGALRGIEKCTPEPTTGATGASGSSASGSKRQVQGLSEGPSKKARDG